MTANLKGRLSGAGLERAARSFLALSWDFIPGLFLYALFDHIWWLRAWRSYWGSGLFESLSLLIAFTFLARFFAFLILGTSLGFLIARLGVVRGIRERFPAAGITLVDFLLAPFFVLQLFCLLFYQKSLGELLALGAVKVKERHQKWPLFFAPRILGSALLLALIVLLFGKIARFFEPTRVIAIEETPLVVNKVEEEGTTYNSNRFRVSFKTDLRDSLGERRLSLIPSFEVVSSGGQKLFYPGIVFFDRSRKSFARLKLYKELEYDSFLSRALAYDPSFDKRYPRLAKALGEDLSNAEIKGIALAREFQDYLLEAFALDTSWRGLLGAPASSRGLSFALWDLSRGLGLQDGFKVSRMTLSNESFLRLHPQVRGGLAGEVEYWLTTQGPKLRVYSLESGAGAKGWHTDEVLPILFKEAQWEFESDKPFPIGRHKESITAVSVIDLYTQKDLSASEREEIGEFIFYHFFELAHEALAMEQVELQTLISDTIERFLIIARHRPDKKSSLYSERLQKTLSDLNSSLKSKDHAYFGIK